MFKKALALSLLLGGVACADAVYINGRTVSCEEGVVMAEVQVVEEAERVTVAIFEDELEIGSSDLTEGEAGEWFGSVVLDSDCAERELDYEITVQGTGGPVSTSGAVP